MADEHIGTREEAIARLRAEQEAHANTRRELAISQDVQRFAGQEIDAIARYVGVPADFDSDDPVSERVRRKHTSLLRELTKEMRERDEARSALPSERVLLMLATAIPHQPLFSQAMRDECTTAIARMSAAVRARVAKPETTDEMIARHNKVNARLLAEAIEESALDDEDEPQAPAQDGADAAEREVAEIDKAIRLIEEMIAEEDERG